jgi:hypothetical protein
LIAHTYKLQVDYFITTAGHGKCLVDSVAGADKAHLGNGFLSGIDPTRVDEYSKSLSEAEKDANTRQILPEH